MAGRKEKSGRYGSVCGFTLIEVVAVIVVMGLVGAAAASRLVDTQADFRSQVSIIKNHIRYAQSMAMKEGAVYGIRSNGTYYWLFKDQPTPASNRRALPGAADTRIAASDIGITLPTFRVFFDPNGRPYIRLGVAGQADRPLSSSNTLEITLDSNPAGASVAFSITPETGYIP
ncbi:MAG: prepilin-type N-terminal cleavage/methylation domain-containing protein [Proteobacteria bacterium]|nr:prepilin-type N-terminal cleavage/methylation domain-containing protein [Pseudomonadota bacterium]